MKDLTYLAAERIADTKRRLAERAAKALAAAIRKQLIAQRGTW